MRRCLPVTIVSALVLAHGGAALGAVSRSVCAVGCDHNSIQQAIRAAAGGDEIVVADGVYPGPVNFGGLAITVRSVNGPTRTMISGNGGSGGAVVTFDHGEGPSSILSGFMIANGLSSGHGGGINASSASPTIDDCYVVSNRAALNGGGIALDNSVASFTSCFIFGNASDGSGGGAYVAGGGPSFSHCTFSSNTAKRGGGLYFEVAVEAAGLLIDSLIADNEASAGRGGGLSVSADALLVYNCTIAGNRASVGGGGVAILDAAAPSIKACTISGNEGGEAGGGVYISSTASPELDGCGIQSNTAALGGGAYLNSSAAEFSGCMIRGNDASLNNGGGVYAATSPASFSNCVISGNRAAGSGGGLWISGVPAAGVVNSTVSGNHAVGGSGGGLAIQNASPMLSNSIFWGNAASTADEIVTIGSGSWTLDYSDVAGGAGGGTGVIDVDPMFLLPVAATAAPTVAGDYRLRSGSPCVNAATPVGAPAKDFEADPRPQGGGFDIGADEVGLLLNGYLEGTSNRPESWTGAGLTVADKLVTDDVHDGLSSFRFKGDSRVDKKLTQTRNVSGKAGQSLIFRGSNKAFSRTGGGGEISIQLLVTFKGGQVGSYRLPFSRSSHSWVQLARIVKMPRDFTKVRVVLNCARRTGWVWFDGVELLLK